MVSRQREWQKKKLAEGKCLVCGKLRGEGGNSKYCAFHKEQNSKRSKFLRESK